MSFDIQNKHYPALVPYWVIKQLERHQLPLSSIFNLELMLTISSAEDLAIMYALNTNPDQATKFYGCLSSEMPLSALSIYWTNEYAAQLRRITVLLQLIQGIDARLLYKAEDQDQPAANLIPAYDKPFEIQPITSGIDTKGALLIIIYPGYFGGPDSAKYQEALVREYMRQSYVFVKYHNLAKDTLFARYMRSTIAKSA